MTLEHFISEWGLTLGLTALMGFMVFIIWDLARQSKAGKFGTLILFIGLGAGLFGFTVKLVIQYLMEQQ
ncbi:DUF2788 domain-containing protein [Teredinibacter turnerae]|uniref:DUF2788 domain-containing protein n=1 Tax=Teredinibacter turnerae TaxID=2426 RepID=UPI00037B37F7|nr:DUF2788 domain-containing protein [Teredinibacter turnerae]